MKNLVFILYLVSQTTVWCQDTSYYLILEPAIETSDTQYTTLAFQNLANVCERIVALRENEWIPWYYMAYANVHLGSIEADETRKDAYFDKAQESLEQALLISPEESEVHLLQAYIYFCRMEINPMQRSVRYFPKAGEEIEKAKALNPDNPRVYYMEGMSAFYKPEFMGGGKTAARPVLGKALELYEEHKSLRIIDPHWGEWHTRHLYDQCVEEIHNE